MASAPELLSTICDELGIEHDHRDTSLKNRVDLLYRYLLDSHQRGRKTVLLIDEAQLLRPQVLEQIRLLTNLETTTEKLLHIILVGQPELKKMLERASLRQLSQRITARFHLQALSVDETTAYIAHRLQVAGLGAQRNPFSPAMVRMIHAFSGGIPRLINVVSERMLLGAWANNTRELTADIFRTAAAEVSGKKSAEVLPAKTQQRFPLGAFAAAGLVVAGVCAAVWFARESLPVESELSSSMTSPLVAQPLIEKPVVESPAIVPERYARDASVAFSVLADYLGVTPVSGAAQDCVDDPQFRCEQIRPNSWNELLELNRPSVLTLITEDKKLAYVTLIGLTDDTALLLDDEGRFTLPWSKLASLWNGRVTYLWRRPPGFDKPVSPGDRGMAVQWLALQFSRLDQQTTPLTRDTYTPVLAKRVELFQRAQGLQADGIAGAQTLRKLNEVLGLDKTLLRDTDAFFDTSKNEDVDEVSGVKSEAPLPKNLVAITRQDSINTGVVEEQH